MSSQRTFWSLRAPPPLLLAAMACTGLAACTLPTEQLALPGPLTGSTQTQPAVGGARIGGAAIATPGDSESALARSWAGTGRFTANPEPATNMTGVRASAAGGVTINLVDATIPEVARTVLGEVMGVTYVVDPKLKGTVTLRTAQPVSKESLVEILEQVLKAEGAVLLVDNGIYRIVPSDAVGTNVTGLRATSKGRRAGYATEVLAPRHVSVEEIERVLKAVAPQANVVRVDPVRNILLISGTAAELASIRETASVFDVDWMRGMSFALHPIETGDPEAVAQELDAVFGNDREGPGKGVVRFVPNRRLKSILVISSRPEYLAKARTWLKRFDLAGRESQKQVHVYHVQNRPAAELAILLQKVYTTQQRANGSSTLPGGQATVGQGAELPPVFDPATGQTSGRRTGDAQAPAPLAAPVAAGAGPTNENAITTGSTGQAGPQDDRTSGISIVSDDANNALVITATASEFNRMRQILTRIDIAQSQVLLEVTIAEVSLGDRLKYGLRWFFNRGGNDFKLTDSALGAVAPAFPGFSYFLNVPNVQVALNALAAITDVNVVSSPSLMVLDNKKATLQVGDEVPIATQSAVSVVTPGAPIVNSVSFRSTGVILGITPRIGDNGRVLLEIEQEVSDVVPTTTSTIDSPTIQQRRVKTTVAVGDGESVVLAGLMQDRSRVTRQQVPLFGNIPVIGNIFKDKDDEIRRTELLIAITPQVVKDAGQIRAIANEFRDRMNFTTRPQRRAPPDRREQVDRLIR